MAGALGPATRKLARKKVYANNMVVVDHRACAIRGFYGGDQVSPNHDIYAQVVSVSERAEERGAWQAFTACCCPGERGEK